MKHKAHNGNVRLFILIIVTLISSTTVLFSGWGSSVNAASRNSLIKINSYQNRCTISKKKVKNSTYNAQVEGYVRCAVKSDKATNLKVTTDTPGAQCNNRAIAGRAWAASNGEPTNLGKARALRCTPGMYTLRLDSPAEFKVKCKGTPCTAYKEVSVYVAAGGKYTYRLGTNIIK